MVTTIIGMSLLAGLGSYLLNRKLNNRSMARRRAMLATLYPYPGIKSTEAVSEVYGYDFVGNQDNTQYLAQHGINTDSLESFEAWLSE
jgi:hypothetical protein